MLRFLTPFWYNLLLSLGFNNLSFFPLRDKVFVFNVPVTNLALFKYWIFFFLLLSVLGRVLLSCLWVGPLELYNKQLSAFQGLLLHWDILLTVSLMFLTGFFSGDTCFSVFSLSLFRIHSCLWRNLSLGISEKVFFFFFFYLQLND